MGKYSYEAVDAGGKSSKGTIDATDQKQAILKLRQQGLFASKIQEASAATAAQKKKSGNISIFEKKNVSVKDLSLFTRQLATLIDAGLPLLRALNILKTQSDHPVLKDVLAQLIVSVSGGATFSDALAEHPKIFSKLFVFMVKAGEVGGVLEIVLKRLAEFSEKDYALQQKIKGAMMYPIIMLIVGIGVVIFLMVGVIPTFADMFEEMGVALPPPTRLMILATGFFGNYWYLVLIAAIAAIVGYKKYNSTDDGKFQIDQIKLKIPALGDMIRKVAVARFTRTLGTLVQSGVPILQALEIVKNTAGNEVIARAMDAVVKSISGGDTIASPLEETGVFPIMVTQMISVGEETGALDDMLIRIADTYDMEVDEAVKALTSSLEPVMIVGMAGVVGFVVISMFMPMFQLTEMVGKMR